MRDIKEPQRAVCGGPGTGLGGVKSSREERNSNSIVSKGESNADTDAAVNTSPEKTSTQVLSPLKGLTATQKAKEKFLSKRSSKSRGDLKKNLDGESLEESGSKDMKDAGSKETGTKDKDDSRRDSLAKDSSKEKTPDDSNDDEDERNGGEDDDEIDEDDLEELVKSGGKGGSKTKGPTGSAASSGQSGKDVNGKPTSTSTTTLSPTKAGVARSSTTMLKEEDEESLLDRRYKHGVILNAKGSQSVSLLCLSECPTSYVGQGRGRGGIGVEGGASGR